MILRKWEKENNNEYYCTKCGETFIIDYIGFSNYRKCPHCGERQQWKYIKRSASEEVYRKFINKEEDGSHFIITKIKKTQYYKVDKSNNIVKDKVKEVKSDFIMDFKNKEFYIQNEKERKEVNHSTMRVWLERNRNISEVERCLKLNSNKEILYFIVHILRPKYYTSEYYTSEKYSKLNMAFEKFCNNYDNYEYIQILANGGVTFFNESYWKFDNLNKEGRSISEICRISKLDFKIAKLLKVRKIYSFINCKGIGDIISFDKFKKYMELGYFGDNNTSYEIKVYLKEIKEVCESFGYDMDRLMKYLNEDIYKNQGIRSCRDGLVLLKDSLVMAKKMGISLKEKYPKSLKLQHDLLAMNYECYKDEYQRQGFKKVVEDKEYVLLNRNKEKENFYIRSPRDLDDLYNYAESLGNCLKSYVDEVIEGRSKIYFMETEKNDKKPYIAIEVKQNNIRQAYRKSNKLISKKEHEFLVKWAKDNEIECNVEYDKYAEEIV